MSTNSYAAKLAPLKGKPVIICDPSLLCRLILRRRLQWSGATVTECADSDDWHTALSQQLPALIFVEERVADEEDSRMVSGLKALTGTSDIPVIMVSASPRPNDRRQAETAGVSRYVIKPFDLDVLMETAAELVDE